MDNTKTPPTIESDIRSPLKEIQIKCNMPEDECNTSQKSFVLFDMENDISKDSVMLPTELNINETNENRENKPRLSIIKTFDPLHQTQYGNLNQLDSVLEQERCALENEFLNHLKLDFLVEDKPACGAETQDSNVNIVQNVLHEIVDIVLKESNAESSDIINTTTHTDINLNFSVEKEPANIVSNVSVPGSVNEDNNTSLVSNTTSNESNIQDNTIIFNKHSSTFLESNELETSASEHAATATDSVNINETYVEPAVDHDETPAVPVNPLKFNALSTADDLSDSFLSSFNRKITISSPDLNQTSILNDSVNEPEVDETSGLCKESFTVPCSVVEQPVDYLNVTTDITPVNDHNFDNTFTNPNQTQDIPPCLDETGVLDTSPNSKTIILDATVNISGEVLTSVDSDTSNSFNTTPAIVSTNPETKPRMSEVNTELNSDLTEPSVPSRLQVEPTTTACTNEMGDVIVQSDCFDKECDSTNGPCDIKRLSVDNKQSFIKEKEDHIEMMERLAGVEAECEKYKLQVTDLKQELKVCRQKSTALEIELGELKLTANKSAASTSDSSDHSEEIKALREREVTVMKEANELKVLVAKLESKQTEMQKKEAKLSDDLNNKTQTEMQISRVMEEYEKSISSLVAENEKMKKERDTAQMHLANIELAFSDVHQKYERCKTIVQGFKDNEESLKQNIAMNEETILKQEQKYETLKSHAMAQLEKSNQELAIMKKQHEQEMARVTAQLKRYEIKNNSLMEALQQKSKECEQLSAVCDEFIGNV